MKLKILYVTGIIIVAPILLSGCLKLDESKLKRTASVHNSELFRGYSWTPGWPAFPRTSAEFVESRNNDSSFSIGPEVSLLGIKWKNKFTTKFSMSWKMNTTLIRHGEKAEIINQDGTLNVEDNIDFVALCLYSANATTGLAWEVEGGVGIVSAANNLGTDKQIVVSQSSNFFNVRKSDSLASIQDKCRVDFQRRVKPSVLSNLSRLIAYDYTERVNRTNPDVSDWVIASDAAKYGPKREKLILPTRDIAGSSSNQGMEWSVSQSQHNSSVDGSFEVMGTINHKRGPFRYAYQFKEGEIVKSEFRSRIGDAKIEEEAKKISLVLSNEVYLEYREEYVPVEFEDYVKKVDESEKLFKSDAYGRVRRTGRGEVYFDDALRTTEDSSIKKVEVQYTDKIIGIKTTLSSGQILGHAFNDNSGNIAVVELADTEYIVSIDVSLGPDSATGKMRIYGLVFKTNSRRTITAGVPTQEHETIYAANGKQITGFYGSVDKQTKYLAQLGAVFSNREITEEIDRVEDLTDLENLEMIDYEKLGDK